MGWWETGLSTDSLFPKMVLWSITQRKPIKSWVDSQRIPSTRVVSARNGYFYDKTRSLKFPKIPHLIWGSLELRWPILFLSRNRCSVSIPNGVVGDPQIYQFALDFNGHQFQVSIVYHRYTICISRSTPRLFCSPIHQASLYQRPTTTPSSQVVRFPGASTRQRTRSPSKNRKGALTICPDNAGPELLQSVWDSMIQKCLHIYDHICIHVHSHVHYCCCCYYC